MQTVTNKMITSQCYKTCTNLKQNSSCGFRLRWMIIYRIIERYLNFFHWWNIVNNQGFATASNYQVIQDTDLEVPCAQIYITLFPYHNMGLQMQINIHCCNNCFTWSTLHLYQYLPFCTLYPQQSRCANTFMCMHTSTNLHPDKINTSNGHLHHLRLVQAKNTWKSLNTNVWEALNVIFSYSEQNHNAHVPCTCSRY